MHRVQIQNRVTYFTLLAVLTIALFSAGILASRFSFSITNSGIFGGIWESNIYTYIIFAVGLLVYLFVAFLSNFFYTVPSLFILAGAISNIGERLFLGGVRDFIDIYFFTINAADIVIFFGLVFLVGLLITKTPSEKLEV